MGGPDGRGGGGVFRTIKGMAGRWRSGLAEGEGGRKGARPLKPPMSSDEAVSTESDQTAYRRDLIRPTWVRRMKWRAELGVFVMIETVLGWLPVGWVAAVGRVAGAATHAFLPKRRRIVMRNLRIAFAGEKTAEELEAMAREVFRRAGANLLCSLRTADMGRSSLARTLVVRDEIVYREAVAKGKGVVMVLAHMGNWEALAQWFPRLLPPETEGGTVYRPLNNPLMNARVAAARARHGIRLFSKDDNPLGMAGFLRRGGVLGVLSDQRAGYVGELVPFCGRITSCTPIPAILARRTGAAVVGVSVRTVGAGRWEMGFHALEVTSPTTTDVMGLVERMMRESPEDVFWLQERWKIFLKVPHLHLGKIPRGGAPVAAKRRRALLWVEADGRRPVPPVPTLADVDYETAERGAGEGLEAFLRRVDEAADLPLDYVVGGERVRGLARTCRRLGMGWVAGVAAEAETARKGGVAT